MTSKSEINVEFHDLEDEDANLEFDETEAELEGPPIDIAAGTRTAALQIEAHTASSSAPADSDYTKLAYSEASIVSDRIGIHCSRCGKDHGVHLEKLRAVFTSMDDSSDARIRKTDHSIRGISQSTHKWISFLLWVIVVFIGFNIGGLMAGVIAALLIFPVLGPIARSFFGTNLPIWLVSCPYCDAIIPIASDGDLFLIGETRTEASHRM
ncbi:MAG: hypothetical protein JXA97_10455 [Anaerolineales bacterium]|nr:hypothetical protein [Anaerolineales bacterium]